MENHLKLARRFIVVLVVINLGLMYTVWQQISTANALIEACHAATPGVNHVPLKPPLPTE